MTPTVQKGSESPGTRSLYTAAKDPLAARRLWAREGRRLTAMVEALTGQQHDTAAVLARAAFDETVRHADLAHPPAGVAPGDWFQGCVRRTALLMVLGGSSPADREEDCASDGGAPDLPLSRMLPARDRTVRPLPASRPPALRPGYEAALLISSPAEKVPTHSAAQVMPEPRMEHEAEPSRRRIVRLALLPGVVALAALGVFGIISWYEVWPSAAVDHPAIARDDVAASPEPIARADPWHSGALSGDSLRPGHLRSYAPSSGPGQRIDPAPIAPATSTEPGPLPRQFVAEEPVSPSIPPLPPAAPPKALSALDPGAGKTPAADAPASSQAAAARLIPAPAPRPVSPDLAAEPQTPEPKTTSPAADSAAPQPPLEIADVRVFIHYRADQPDARNSANLLASRLERAGFQVMPPRAVHLAIDHGSVRFYADDARKAARALLAAVQAAGPELSSGSAWRLRDFSHDARRPRDGTLEIWLPSTPAPGRAGTA